MTRKVVKSAINGRFVSVEDALANPDTTISQTVTIGTPKATAAMLLAGGEALRKWLKEQPDDFDPTEEEVAELIWDTMRPLEGKS